MSVQEYLNKHMLSRKIEDAVNAAVRAKSPDPVLFISNHMRKAVPSVITKIKARQILDSRGIPTVEVDLFTHKGMFRASVPSGDPSGMYEALELRDGDKGTYLGNSVNRAVKNINERISEALVGMDPILQSQIDQAMIDLDKTEKKGELGANAILAVSIAACKAGAVPLYKHIADLAGKTNLTLPVPAFTVISGGKHAGNNLAIQDIMILPIGASSFGEALQMGSETYHHLKAVIAEKYGAHGCNVGEDGGLDLVKEAINRTGYNEKIKMAIDVAATDFCKERAIHDSTCNALLLKINQIGTVTEAIEVVKLANDVPWGVVISHRSGETEDSFIADLSVGLASGQIKAGAPCRGERLAKYNQLLHIEEELGDHAIYAGEDYRQYIEEEHAAVRTTSREA
ncbi:hypothetical protein CUMW_032850 [Citrus unshiu]|nr:hypothetical protein CUMW_032850 [Citrus unshiu]